MARPLHVVIWDLPGDPTTTNCSIVYWNKFFTPAHSQDEISLPRYVEDNSDKLKERFLVFVREVGESQIAGKSTIEHLGVLPDFSYWWMTLFACKRWSTTSSIIEAVRLLALEDILREIKPTNVTFATEQIAIKHVIRDWCARSGIKFQSLTTPSSLRPQRSQLSILNPRPLRAVIVLIREAVRRISAPKHMSQSDNSTDVVLIDYLSRFDAACALQGEYRSGFWNLLIDTLDSAKQNSLFLHQFVANSVTPNRRATIRFLDGLNSRSKTQRHFPLDGRVSMNILVKAILIYIRLLKVRFRIRTIKHSFSPSGSQLDLWILFKKEWLDSLSGSTAILHSLAISELDGTIMKIPPCRTVLYLMENQPWEMAFIQLWKQRRSELLIGVPHASIRYWDLRYFSTPDAADTKEYAAHPVPNIVAANGSAALKSLNKSGIPAERIIEVEALAYLYLGEIREKIDQLEKSNSSVRLLVLGDFFNHQNMALLTMLQSSLDDTEPKITVTVKPHPSCLVDQQDYPHLRFKIDTRQLSEQLTECDIVLATNGTSASAEAYQYGLPVITILNGETFNFSPLRDEPDAVFADSPTNLAKALGRAMLQNQAHETQYFTVDKSLKRWRHLLSL